MVVEMPDQRLLTIQPLDPGEDDSLIDELLASDPRFAALVARSRAGARKAFSSGSDAWGPADAIHEPLAASGRTFSDSAELLQEDRDR